MDRSCPSYVTMSTTTISTTPSTYTESHKKSYEKRRESELQRMKTYYLANAEVLKANRRARYAAKKESERAAAISV